MGSKNEEKTMNTIVPGEWVTDNVQNKETLYALHNNLLSEVSLPSSYRTETKRVFSKRVKCRGDATQQNSSGRCWIFAALNMMRSSGFITKNSLPQSFEFSQSYVFFWDKFERVNYFLNVFETTRDKDLDGRLMQFLLKEPLGDGGQWQMFVNLVEKYGVVPKDVFPETKHSSNSAGINMVLTKKVREYCRDIRAGKSRDRKVVLKEVFELLVKFLGKPPQTFTWEYYTKDGEAKRRDNVTPVSFYKDVVQLDLKQYVSLIHDPRNEYGKRFGIEYLQNVAEGDEVVHLNVDMDKIVTLCKKSIDAGEPVWFGCDVGQFMRSQSNIMDEKCFDMEGFLHTSFTLNKRERIEYGESLMTHAMVITGYNEDAFGKINRWEIENSWGSKGPGKGYYVMTDQWMHEFVYQITVRKSMLSDTEKQRLDSSDPVKKYMPWDPMGALAS